MAMDILLYNELDNSKVRKQFAKVLQQLKDGDWASADMKKMSNTGFYRAKLDDTNRLLIQIAKFEGRTTLLVLEVILNHDYRGSRFLGGREVDESKLVAIKKLSEVPESDMVKMPYINPKSQQFYLLNKVISFDTDQAEVFALPLPLIVIGSAGSGKTALTLEKIKTLQGNILYITLSPFLVENSSNLFYSFGYKNEDQNIDFLSFKEFIETIRIPSGRELSFRQFDGWFQRYRNTVKIRNSYKLFEEFKGVITGMRTDKTYMSRQDYMDLGIKQSVFLMEERGQVYDTFEKFLTFLKEENLYDLNMVAVEWQPLTEEKYDFIIVDEVQDLTNAQLFLILKSLKKKGQFLLCGDSNQIVHPNFFSWSNIKTMFYQQESLSSELRILHTNYRNSPQVTEVANRLLKIKNSRFGSIDRESTYLVNPVSEKIGEVVCLPDNPKIKQELNQKTKLSANFAVIVMSNDDKAEAARVFQTPLLFSVHEAKGLEYENIIIYNFVSSKSKEFLEITANVSLEDVNADEIKYVRGKDKSDKSLDVYKFYVNSLYVAITRAVQNLYVIEASQKHPLLDFLNLIDQKDKLDLKEQKSSLEDWTKEARRLEMQGKNEQADLIKLNILGNQKTPWTPITTEELVNLKLIALDPEVFNKKAKDRLFDFALMYNDNTVIKQLADLKYRRAEKPELERLSIFKRSYAPFAADDPKKLADNIRRYGIDYRDEFNLTPLLAAVKTGAIKIAEFLLENDANQNVYDNFGMSPFMLVLQQAHFDVNYFTKKLPLLYNKLKPDFIKIKVDNRLIKLYSHGMEFFLLQNLMVLQTEIIAGRKIEEYQGFTADDLLKCAEKFDSQILPEFRKKRQYLSSMLAKNEANGNDPYNRKLFLRVTRGVYIINTDLELGIDEEWANVYDILQAEKVDIENEPERVRQAILIMHSKLRAEYEAKREAENAKRQKEWMRRYGNWNR
jgi:UvrD-like helicase C-terminal domain